MFLLEKLGTIEVWGIGKNNSDPMVKIHMVKCKKPFLTNAFIIQTQNALVVIDSLLSEEEGEKLRAYANTLEKPIEMVILTHPHYDHYMGLPSFSDCKTYGLEINIKEMQEAGKEEKYIPKYVLSDKFEVDSIKYESSNIINAHCKNHLLLLMPTIGLVASGDLLAATNHLLPYDYEAYVDGMHIIYEKTKTGYTHFLAGHDVEPSDIKYVKENLDYMEECLKIANSVSSLEELDVKIKATFPNMLLKQPVYSIISQKWRSKYKNEK
jgi:glyoxylase-like metal-dependent hydrolase (beta-lactamase superfamily II)